MIPIRYRAVRKLCRTILAASMLAGPLAAPLHADGRETVSALSQRTHFHGIAIAPGTPQRLYLATHHGLWQVAEDGAATRLSDHGDDLMGFVPHPRDRARLYASGHPAAGGNLGVIESRDGGRSWSRLSAGVGGPVDFHQMDVSKADPRVLYGVHGGLQKSADGGRNWTRVGPAPDGLIALAASARDAATLYAATRAGLLRSADGGRSWRRHHSASAAATAVHVTPAGEVLAFLVGVGLVRAAEGEPAWRRLGGGPDGGYLLHLAPAPDGRRIYAVAFDARTRQQSVVESADGGAAWRPLGANLR